MYKKQLIVIALFLLHTAVTLHAQTPRIIQPFDKDWHFNKGDSPGAEAPAFSDASWRTLDVPHDWSIEGPYDRNNPTGRGGGYLPSGIGWYRKTFVLSDAAPAG